MSIKAHRADRLDLQKDWIRAVCAALTLKPSQLARQAGLDPSTLTRPLNDPDYVHSLHPHTIAAIEQATGFKAYDKPGETPAREQDGDAEIFDWRGVPDCPAKSAIASIIGNNNALTAWRITTRSVETLGYMPGDIVIVDKARRPRMGDMVLAELRPWPASAPTIVVRVFNPPFLAAATYDPTLHRPLAVDDRTVIVSGCVMAMFRARAAA